MQNAGAYLSYIVGGMTYTFLCFRKGELKISPWSTYFCTRIIPKSNIQSVRIIQHGSKSHNINHEILEKKKSRNTNVKTTTTDRLLSNRDYYVHIIFLPWKKDISFIFLSIHSMVMLFYKLPNPLAGTPTTPETKYTCPEGIIYKAMPSETFNYFRYFKKEQSQLINK